jgi:hypothetical protein
MAPHFIIAVSETRFRVLERFARPGQTTASLREIVTHGAAPVATARGGDHGRPGAFAGRRGETASAAGGAELRRAVDWLCDQIERFLIVRPGLAWAFAAGPEIHDPVLQHLRPSLRGSLVESVQHDLSQTAPSEIAGHFKVRL